MKFERLNIPDVILVTPARHGDSRGFFSETYVKSRFQEGGILPEFIQDNHSFSAHRGVVRGLHCQVAPSVQGKLVRVIRGAIWDVAVDVRMGSPTFGRYAAAELSAENWCQLWIPGGFLHGFCTLTADTEVVYKVTAGYDLAAERGVVWNDPTLALPWPVSEDQAMLSHKDKELPEFTAAAGWFPSQ